MAVNFSAVAQSSDARAARANPRWVPDDEASHCMACKTFEFWVMARAEWRRHHCRSCGWVVCKGCLAPNAVELDRWVSSTAVDGHPINHRQIDHRRPPDQPRLADQGKDSLPGLCPGRSGRGQEAGETK